MEKQKPTATTTPKGCKKIERKLFIPASPDSFDELGPYLETLAPGPVVGVLTYIKAGEALEAGQYVFWGGDSEAFVLGSGPGDADLCDVKVGFTGVAIPSGHYGWVQMKGPDKEGS